MYRVWYKVGAGLEVFSSYDPVSAIQKLIDLYDKSPLFVSQGAYKVWLEYIAV